MIEDIRVAETESVRHAAAGPQSCVVRRETRRQSAGLRGSQKRCGLWCLARPRAPDLLAGSTNSRFAGTLGAHNTDSRQLQHMPAHTLCQRYRSSGTPLRWGKRPQRPHRRRAAAPCVSLPRRTQHKERVASPPHYSFSWTRARSRVDEREYTQHGCCVEERMMEG